MQEHRRAARRRCRAAAPCAAARAGCARRRCSAGPVFAPAARSIGPPWGRNTRSTSRTSTPTRVGGEGGREAGAAPRACRPGPTKGKGKPGPGREPRPGLGTRSRAGRGVTARGARGYRLRVVRPTGAAGGRLWGGGTRCLPRLYPSFLCCVKEYVEKPLKLVLKVGGNEVAELSTGSAGLDSSLYEDKSEHEKHKDRKRKKRKKGEKQVPGEEKEKRKRKVKVCVCAIV